MAINTFLELYYNIFSVFLHSYRNTCGSLGNIEIAWKNSPPGLVFPLSFSQSFNSIETEVKLNKSYKSIFKHIQQHETKCTV